MDGRGNLRRNAPWGWQATTWQAWAFLLLAGLVLTNAAWFYTSRVRAVEHAALAAARPAVTLDRAHAPVLVTPPVMTHARELEPGRYTPSPGERCISGQRFAVVDGELRNIGTC